MRRLVLGCALVVLLSMPFLAAQDLPEFAQGTKLYGSYHGGAIDVVGLENGNLFLRAPLFSYSQRGSDLAYPVVLTYNGNNFSTHETCPPPNSGTKVCDLTIIFAPARGRPARSTGASVTAGFEGLNTTAGSGMINTGLSFDGNPIYVQTTSALTPDGSLHQLVSTDNGLAATDGSRFTSSGVVEVTDGNGNVAAGGTAFDRNGNQLSATSTGWTDTLGRQIPSAPMPTLPPAAPNPSTASLGSCPALNYLNQPVTFAYTWSLPTFSNVTNTLILCYSSVIVRTGTVNGPHYFDVNQSFPMLQSVVFPDNTYWAFEYDAADPNNTAVLAYGDLLKVTFPTGGSISYAWGMTTPCNSSNLITRAVQTRTVDANDGTGPHPWTYNSGIVRDPMGNETVHTFTGLGGTCSDYETQTQYFQGPHSGGTLLKTVNTDYTFTANPWDSNLISQNGEGPSSVTNVLPIRVTTTLPNGQTSKVETDYDSGFSYHGPLDGLTWNDQSCYIDNVDDPPHQVCSWTASTTNPVTNYTASYGKPVATREYDWGQGAPGALLRQTLTTYKWQVNSAYKTANMLDLPATVKTFNGVGNLCAETDYEYDEASATTPSPAINTQHTSPPAAVRGNLTTITRKLSATPCSASATWTNVSSHTAWFDTGEAQSSSDPLGHSTTHLYDAAYAGAYPTQTCNALSQCVSGAYDFNTGLLTSYTDANSQTSNFSYDTNWRMVQALSPLDPVLGARPETDFSYANLTTVKRNKKQDSSGHLITDYAYFDGVGRTKQTQLVDPEGDDFVDTVYDGVGQVSTVSNPHRSASSQTDGITTYIHDALGRATQVTYQDGSISTTDYSNLPAVTVTDQAGKLRGSRTDALGRLVEVDEPGAGANTPGTPGSGSITISGALQSSTTSGTKATGWFSVSGSDDYVLNCPPDLLCSPRFSPKLWDSGAVYVSVNGVQAGAGYGQNSNAAAMASSMAAALSPHPITFSDPGTGTISVTADTAGPNYSLSWSSMSNDPNDFGAGSFSVAVSGPTLTGGVYPVTTYDAGTLTVTVNGFQASAAYNQNLNSTPAALATALAAALNVSGSPVTASASSSTITLTSKAVGTAADYSVSGSSTASFTASGTTLSGGTDPGGLFAPLVTQYQYDGLGNLLRVDQKGTAPNDSTQWRTRTFTYDSLSRILTSSNPESGTITYSYDLDGNLLQKTSPAPNQTGTATQTVSYCYDALHRVTGKGYGAQSCPLATPVVSYTYDVGTNAKGHLTSLTDQAGTASYTYDNLGRLTTETRPIAGVSKSTSYTYNLDGSVKTLTYPSTRVVTYAANSAGRLVSVVDANGANYGMSGTHWPDGALKTFANGSTPALNQNFQYTPRLQLCRITALTSGTLPTSCTDTLHTGNIMDRGYDFHAGNGTAGSGTDNSNVFAITNYRDATRSQAFTYDALNRLSSGWSAANTGAYSWGESYSIDAWGNLQVAPMQNKAHGGNFANSSDLTNHPIGLGYDAAGNMTNYTAPGQYVYDAENRLSSAAGMSYTYDGNGERVLKFNTSTGAAVKRYWSIGGNTLAEGDGSGSLSAEYIYFGGKRIARIDLPANTVHYYLSDHLDSTSIIASAAGTVEEESDYYPFGTEVVVTAGPNSRKFTGKERDTESGLDNFGARYYGSALGRFVSADPVMIMRQRMFDPQQWNMYAYARNNPLRFKDENGKWPTPVHETIIDRAFPGLTPGQRALMKEYSAIQDQCPTCQMKSHNHQHYMKSPGEDPVKAKQAAESYIKQHEQAAQKEQGGTPAHAADINARSINEFTQAEHAVTDGTSPAHVDANGMPRDWNGIPITSGDWDKVHQHEAEEADPTPEQLNNAINTAQQAFKDSYGEQAYQEAITPPPSQKKEEPK